MYRQFRIPETQITAKHERDKNVFEATGNTRGIEDESYKLVGDLDFYLSGCSHISYFRIAAPATHRTNFVAESTESKA